MLRIYLIGICNDKPANSLVQNLPEPNALYGCSKCEIAGNFFSGSRLRRSAFLFILIGKTTPAKLYAATSSKKITTTYIRIFPTIKNDQPELRSNYRWFEISHALQNKYTFLTADDKAHSFGYLGDCELTNLAFIDRGESFMSDTLHTIYHGAFVCKISFFKTTFDIALFKTETFITPVD